MRSQELVSVSVSVAAERRHAPTPIRRHVSPLPRHAIVTIERLLKQKNLMTGGGSKPLMKNSKTSLLLVATLAAKFLLWSASAATPLQGAGATFPAPLYQRWIAEYTKGNPDVQINYQGVGSGAGIKQFTQNLVSFGASDAAMTDAEIKAVKQGVVLIPATAGSIVLAYNLPGVENLKLSREAYVGIFLGKITKWNDPAIAKANEGAKLPSTAITVCERSDGSGTTFVFTKHLSAISPDFKDHVGEGTSVTWPIGVAGKGNDGVTALIKQTQAPSGISSTDTHNTTNCRLPHFRINPASLSPRPPPQGPLLWRPPNFQRICCVPGLRIRTEKNRIRSQLLPGCYSTKITTTLQSVRRLRNSSISASPTDRNSLRISDISRCPKKSSTKTWKLSRRCNRRSASSVQRRRSAFSVQRSAFSVQRSAFSVQRRSQDIGNTYGSGHR